MSRSPLARLGWRPWHYALLLLLHLHFFESGSKTAGRDMVDVFYPWADALRISILKFHQFPWWDPWPMTGQPLFADPGSVAVFMPDTLFILLFGTVIGLKVTIVFYVLLGYEGCRFLCRHLFGDHPFVNALSVIPAIIPALALHFNEGHIVFVVFYLFPWLLALGLTWERSAGRAVALGAVMGGFLLSYIHYTMIMAFTLVAPIVLYRFRRFATSRDAWMKAGLVLCTALGLALTRLGVSLAIIAQFPRTDPGHYPTVASLIDVIRTLVEPLQDRNTPANIADLGWWELGSYVGLPALFLAYEGLRRGARRYWPLHAAALLCLVLAWNNRDAIFPSYWLHFVPPWKNMIVISRWSLFACFFILIGAVQGLDAIRRGGRPLLAYALAGIVVLDLGFHTMHAYRDSFTLDQPPMGEISGPPKTVYDRSFEVWGHQRMNLASMGAVCSLVGWGLHPPQRVHIGMPGYNGEFVGSQPVQVESWTPNRFVLIGSPGDTVTLNINPSNYWVMNGRRLFPKYRAFEIDKPFQVTVPSEGRMEFVASDPLWKPLALVQLLFALLAAFLFRTISKTSERSPLAPASAST